LVERKGNMALSYEFNKFMVEIEHISLLRNSRMGERATWPFHIARQHGLIGLRQHGLKRKKWINSLNPWWR
jgi:hypothetical protein